MLSLSSITAPLQALFLSLSSLLLCSLPSLPLLSLHTYIHPDHLPSSSSSLTLRPPSHKSDPNPQSPSQLLRLSLTTPLLLSRPFFSLFRFSFLLFLPALSSPLLLKSPFPLLSTLTPSLLSLLFSLSLSSLHRPSAVSVLSSALALAVTAPSIPLPAVTACSLLAFSLSSPAILAARSFWLGTDQLRWGLDVITCAGFGRWLLHASMIAGCAAAASPLAGVSDDAKACVVAAAAAGQLAAMRINVQMYLNEGVLVWYQRLHGGKVPDLDYGRAKVFLHDHYVCLVALRFFAPPVLVLVLVGMSRMGDGVFGGTGIGGGYVSFVREWCLFFAWWIVLAWTVTAMCTVALLRHGILSIS